MDIPKNQKDLINILIEQEKQIESLKKAIRRMDQTLRQVAKLAENTQRRSHRLTYETKILSENIRVIHTKL